MSTKYVVKDEHTLGYLQEATPYSMGVLSSKIGGHNPVNGAVAVVPGVTRLRDAAPADFDAFRVVLPPDFQH